jgi:hypothetical protein
VNWTKNKPTKPGIYKVKGFNMFRAPSKQRVAVVEVRSYRGRLHCNLHESNSSDDPVSEWSWMQDLNSDFQWCGPLVEESQ